MAYAFFAESAPTDTKILQILLYFSLDITPLDLMCSMGASRQFCVKGQFPPFRIPGILSILSRVCPGCKGFPGKTLPKAPLSKKDLPFPHRRLHRPGQNAQFPHPRSLHKSAFSHPCFFAPKPCIMSLHNAYPPAGTGLPAGPAQGFVPERREKFPRGGGVCPAHLHNTTFGGRK